MISQPFRCPICGGSGQVKGDQSQCHCCHGRGIVWSPDGRQPIPPPSKPSKPDDDWKWHGNYRIVYIAAARVKRDCPCPTLKRE